MLRGSVAIVVALLTLGFAHGADPKPLWEIDLGTSEGFRVSPGWLMFSPDGHTVATVVVRERVGERPEFQYQLRVWDTESRKQRFSAELGSSRTQHLGDELATFASDESILTGGSEQTTRSLKDGTVMAVQASSGPMDHTVWSVPDIGETFTLRRDPVRHGLPAELLHLSPYRMNDEFVGRRARYGGGLSNAQTSIHPPREGLQAEPIAMNFSRTYLATAFRDTSPVSNPRHALVLYQIKTIEELELIPFAEAENPNGAMVSALAFARNGKTLVTGGEDGSVSFWNTSQSTSVWKPRATVTGVADHRVTAIAFSRDWRLAAAVTWDKSKPNVMLMDVDSGKLIHAASFDRRLVAVAFSPDGRTLLTGSAFGKIQAWDLPRMVGEVRGAVGTNR